MKNIKINRGKNTRFARGLVAFPEPLFNKKLKRQCKKTKDF
jgi:hypothetical protein